LLRKKTMAGSKGHRNSGQSETASSATCSRNVHRAENISVFA
jgi:hypothetical protein